MDPEDAGYMCTLDAASVKKAKDELNEDPADRLSAVKALRDWIKAQPHINFPKTDTAAMLVFLRGAKFSQIRAREMMEGNLSLKAFAPDWFLEIDSLDTKIQEVIDTGYVLPLPKRNADGCAVLMYRMGAIKPNQFDYTTLMRTAMIVGSYITEQEMTQVNGSVFVFDFTGATTAHMTAMMNRKDMAKWQKFWQKNIPGRFKGFHYYNCGLFFETLMAFSRPFMPKKIKERIKCHDTAESLYADVPKHLLPEEFLPDDYSGPSAGPVKDIIASFKKVTQDPHFRDDFLYRTGKQFYIDSSKQPVETATTHFRKLNVD